MVLPEEVIERLNLLRDSGQIEEKTYACVEEQIEQLVKTNRINPHSETMGSLTTHFAIAVERMNQGEPITELSEQIKEVVEKNPELYAFAQQIINRCLWKEGAYQTKAEAGFMTLYLALPH